ncbi:nucleoside hydrolase [Flaviflexus massiliensis]|uniref:nucleoside hydrolase n=1 Tax=Flaviflexus massiliensis TaxID=1522309 RepID=UPI0006D5A807|nr:nucleoside hydrolase [Flaviflexus massiliensis]
MVKDIILDCDPGHDDAIAILLAAGHHDINLRAITTVGGNQTLEKVTRNALGLATLAGITAPISAGHDGPLNRNLVTSPEIHGESGLDGVTLPDPAMDLDPRHGVDLIIDAIMESDPGTITLVPTGPLTNIASALQKQPEIASRVAEVSLMGGGASVGNATAAAEFNILVDPEAADIVFSAPWKVTMVGLDVTHEAQATPDVLDQIRALNTPISSFVDDLMAFFIRSNQREQQFAAPPVHDPVAVAHVIDPGILATEHRPIFVETAGKYTTGMTLVDRRPWINPDKNTHVATGIDVDRFWDHVINAIGNL